MYHSKLSQEVKSSYILNHNIDIFIIDLFRILRLVSIILANR